MRKEPICELNEIVQTHIEIWSLSLYSIDEEIWRLVPNVVPKVPKLFKVAW